jgi:glycosyltransferase involved in cell wall biosynthesis
VDARLAANFCSVQKSATLKVTCLVNSGFHVHCDITVIVPTYNRSAELRRALDSLRCQNTRGFEVVVCDDGSEEDIRAVVEPFEQFLDVRYIRTNNSGGPARPRNIAAAQAKGQWLSFLDSDDWWDANRMDCVRKFLTSEADLVYHGLLKKGLHGELNGKESLVGRKIGADPLRDMIVRGNPIATSAAIVKRSIFERIGGFDEDPKLAAVEDFDAWLKMAEQGCIFSYLPKKLGCYWLGNDNISARSRLDRHSRLFEKHLLLIDAKYHPLAFAHFSYALGSIAAAEGQQDLANEYFRKIRVGTAPVRWIFSRVKMSRRRAVN